MVRCGYTSLLLFICVTHATCQFYDFFSGLQPFLQTPRPQYDVTQKPRKATTKARLNHATESNRLTLSPVFQSSQRNSTKRTQKPKNVDRNEQVYFIEDSYSNRYTTQNPFANWPNVKPAVDAGPPITNKPPTTTGYGSPELILGPDVSYMSSTERRRHLDIAEKMCDKYKSLNVKEVQAIPLVPSPRPIKVNVSSCLPSKVPLVVGGKVVSIKEFPHMTLLGWPKTHSTGYSWKCGGSLLSDRYVLTAAHCAYQDKDNNVEIGPPHAVQLGSSYQNDPGALVVKVLAAIRHPNYKLPKSYYDIALIKLVKPVSFSDVIRPACLGTPPSPGDPIIATGWGKTEFGGDLSKELRSVSIPVWDIQNCREVLGTSRKIPDGPSQDTQICAGEMEGGKDTCQGDSGGPAQIQDGCVWRVVAVTSLGRSCGAPRTPALYAIVEPIFTSAVIFSDQTNKRTDSNSRNYDTQNSQVSNKHSVSNNENKNRNNKYGNSDSTQNEGTMVYNNDNQNSDSYSNSKANANQNNRNKKYNADNSNYNLNSENYNPDYTNNYNQNTRNNQNSRSKYETTTVKYISYDAIHKKNTNLNQHGRNPQESSYQYNYDYQNDDSNTYSRNRYNDRNNYNDGNINSDRNNYNDRNINSDRINYNDRNINSDRINYNDRNINSDRNNYNDRNINSDRNNYNDWNINSNRYYNDRNNYSG